MAEPAGRSVKMLPSGKCCCLNERIFPVEENWRIEFKMELFPEIAELKLGININKVMNDWDISEKVRDNIMKAFFLVQAESFALFLSLI